MNTSETVTALCGAWELIVRIGELATPEWFERIRSYREFLDPGRVPAT
ncbi:hypothetical protein K7711_46575 [Nocardia sp. CA2R105]|nr:hypothetical protein [Nocardia coffeae]MBY8863998.1 hypothetical protein [Nocardia coffeae]